MYAHALKVGRAYAIAGVGNRKESKFRGVKKGIVLEAGVETPNSLQKPEAIRRRAVGVRVLFEGDETPHIVSAYALVMEWARWQVLTLEQQYERVPTCKPEPEKVITPRRRPRVGDRLGFVPVVDGSPRITHLSAFYDYDKQREGCYIALEDGRILRYTAGDGAWRSVPAIPMQVNRIPMAQDDEQQQPQLVAAG